MIRKPHNLITEYWDDAEYFLAEAEKMELERMGYAEPRVYNKRSIRHCILSSFFFLEAFINGEYFERMNFGGPISELNLSQREVLEGAMKISFEQKWSKWINEFIGKDKINLENETAFKNLRQLRILRNFLAHYKIQDLMLVAHDIQTIETARRARQIAADAVKWYYDKTTFVIPEWIARDVLNQKS